MAFLALVLEFFKVLLFKLLSLFGSSKSSSSSSKLPPSPPSVPILGHLQYLLGKPPHKSLQELARRYGGLFFLKLGIHNTIVVSTAEAARELLKTQDHVFASRPRTTVSENFGYGGFGLLWAKYGDYWRSVRKLCTLELLTAKRVEKFQDVRKEEMLILLQEIQRHDNRPVRLTSMIMDLTFNVMTRMVMSKSYSSGSLVEKKKAIQFKDLIAEAFTVAGRSFLADNLPYLRWIDRQARKIAYIQKRLDEYISAQLVEHREKPGNNSDFLDMMLAAGELTDKSVKSLCMVRICDVPLDQPLSHMIAAGTDTSAVTIDWALAELVRNPPLMLRAQEELKQIVGNGRTLDETDLPKLSFLQAIVKETLRLHPAAPLGIPHESVQACELEGYTIPAGTRAIINLYAIARDPRWWEEPDKFDPERFVRRPEVDMRGQSFELLPFGSGRRSCPGMHLAITTVQFVLGSLLHAFDWSIPAGEEVDMSEGYGATIPRLAPLRLVPLMRLDRKALV